MDLFMICTFIFIIQKSGAISPYDKGIVGRSALLCQSGLCADLTKLQ